MDSRRNNDDDKGEKRGLDFNDYRNIWFQCNNENNGRHDSDKDRHTHDHDDDMKHSQRRDDHMHKHDQDDSDRHHRDMRPHWLFNRW